ncbi:hypothetical protein E3V36_04695 [Candidatus Marinimicrobia bacterium MT.SAG.2]|nr:hypothetical protein E3V36_04695 [Candidatus Marinimicrobia bacterium MT.SAG.2]
MSFITMIIIAKVFGKELFGDFSYAITVGGYCITIANCGLERTLIRDLVHFPKRFDEYASASILLRGSMLTLALVGIFGVNALVAEENQLRFGGILIVLTMGIKAFNLAAIYDAWDNMKRSAVYLLSERSLYFICIWTFILFFEESLSITAISIFMFISVILGLSLQYRWALPQLNLRMDQKANLLAVVMLKKNLWVWSAIIATLSFGGLSKIVLKHISGSGELGEYSVAWLVVLLGMILITQVGRVGNPRIARIVKPGVSPTRRIRFLLQYTALSAMAGTVIGLPAIFFSTQIMQIFPPEYASAASSMRILGFYVIAIGIGQVATQYLVAVRKERVYFIIVFLTGGLSVVLFYLLIPQWMATGAALAVLLAHGTAIFLNWIVMIRHLLFSNEEIQV